MRLRSSNGDAPIRASRRGRSRVPSVSGAEQLSENCKQKSRPHDPMHLTAMDATSRLANDFNRSGTDFLRVEVQTGLTFADIAMREEPGSGQWAKNRNNARKAYDTVLRLRGRLEITNQAAAHEIEEGLKQLRSALVRLGERIA